MRRLFMLLAVLVVMCVPITSHALLTPFGCGADGVCTLDELTAGGSLVVDDLLFDSWSQTIPADNEIIEGWYYDDSGIEIDGGLPSGTIEYNVTMQNPDFLISDFKWIVILQGEYENQVGITTTLSDTTGNILYSLTFGCEGAGGLEVWEDDSVVFDELQSTVHVRHDIWIEHVQQPAFYGVGDLSVAFSQTEIPSVPEPATMLLLGTGLIGLAGFRRRFRK